MAIIKTVFTGTTAAANAAEVTAWLQENGTDLFTSVTNESNVITCNTEGGGSIKFVPYQRNGWYVTLDNGNSHEFDQYSGNQLRIGYKTSKGIVLVTNNHGVYFIGKSNNNSIAVVAVNSNDRITRSNYYFCDLTYSTSFKEDSNNIKHTQMGMTSLCACPLGNSGTYGDGLYFMPFFEYEQIGIMSLGGTSYVTDSWFALEE